MYVIGENQHLLERFGLLAYNARIDTANEHGEAAATIIIDDDDDDDEATAVFTPCLADDRQQCARAIRWIILVSSQWEPKMLSTIGDICRLIMSSHVCRRKNEHARARSNFNGLFFGREF